MLASKLQSASKVVPEPGGIQFIGSATKAVDDASLWDSPEEALDVFGAGAQIGDLVVIAVTFRLGDNPSIDWRGMPFTQLFTSSSAYVGYRFIQIGDANPYLGGGSSDFEFVTCVAAIFRGVSSYVNITSAAGSSGLPNPPSSIGSRNLTVVTGHITRAAVPGLVAPNNYTLAGLVVNTSSDNSENTTTAIAYRIETLSSDDPTQFFGLGSTRWNATTMAFT